MASVSTFVSLVMMVVAVHCSRSHVQTAHRRSKVTGHEHRGVNSLINTLDNVEDVQLPKTVYTKEKQITWPGGVVYYTINQHYRRRHRKIIMKAMLEIEENTRNGSRPCILFVKRSFQHAHIHIRQKSGCNSPIGTNGHGQMVSIAHRCLEKGIIIHELMHVLGFRHEHVRLDRDQYIDVHTDNILTGHLQDFAKENKTFWRLISYDYASIMHYSPYFFAKDTSYPSLTPRQGHNTSGVTLGNWLAMSEQDVMLIQKAYGCPVDTSHIINPSETKRVVKCTFDHGLCELTQDSEDDFDWIRHSGSTPTRATGPNADRSTSLGYYLYAEASRHCGKRARLLTPVVKGGTYCLDFWLFMFGQHVNKLKVILISMQHGQPTTERDIRVVHGPKGKSWKRFRSKLKVKDPSFRIAIEAWMGCTRGDIAIDDFVFFGDSCV